MYIIVKPEYLRLVEWLQIEEIPLEWTITEEKYLDYLATQLGLATVPEEVGKELYRERYNYAPLLGIHSFLLIREYEGIEYTETRYGIKGYPGAWGKERMYIIAMVKAEEMGEYDIARWYERKLEEL